jgi:hypothetical protein
MGRTPSGEILQKWISDPTRRIPTGEIVARLARAGNRFHDLGPGKYRQLKLNPQGQPLGPLTARDDPTLIYYRKVMSAVR